MREYLIGIPSEPPFVEMYRMNHISQEDQKRVVDFVTFSGEFDPKVITRAEGRSVFFPLLVPVIGYDTVQISGAGYLDLGITDNSNEILVLAGNEQSNYIAPPRNNPGEFTHRTAIVSEGKQIILVQCSPIGSYSEQEAIQKYENTIRAFNLVADEFPFLVPLPITLLKYRDLRDSQGSKLSAIVFGCPSGGTRAEHFFTGVFNTALNSRGENTEAFVTEQFKRGLFPLMFAIGNAVRYLHQQNLCHYQMTMGNVSPALEYNGNYGVCVYDWETLQRTDEIDPKLARVLDMSVTIASLTSILKNVFYQRLNLSPEKILEFGYNSLLHYLSGYTGIEVQALHQALGLSPEDMVSSVLGSPQEIVNSMNRLIFPKTDLIT